ncbi:hypothetical protein [Parerythrobacter aestuarii]|uniref:hypothetical protein n=1 Tax=Parerythrobacter aestuarii TaxID=3020909 RepID=UPI0024DE71AC|nr:hypothetical protein [Parerythrobacter aestuarii]
MAWKYALAFYFVLALGALAIAARLESLLLAAVFGVLMAPIKLGTELLFKAWIPGELNTAGQLVLGGMAIAVLLVPILWFGASSSQVIVYLGAATIAQYFVHTIIAYQEGKPNERTS